MKKHNSNSFYVGLKIIISGEPFSIIENQFIKPGKGQSFNRVKMRNLLSSKIIEKTFRSNEFFEEANIHELDMKFIYKSKSTWFFLDSHYEQYEVSEDIIGDNKKWIKEQDDCVVVLWNNSIILVYPPNFVILKVVDTSPDTKNDSLSGNKLAELETGAFIKVPFFIKNNEFIKVNTKLLQYVSRVKRS